VAPEQRVWDEAISLVNRRHNETILDGRTSYRFAITFEQATKTGLLVKDNGESVELNWSDPQQLEMSTPVESSESHETPEPRDDARDPDLPASSRLEAIIEWASEGGSEAADFVSSELDSLPTEAGWRNALVLAADRARFDSADARARASTALLQITRQMRDSNSQEDAQIVWCAIHRAGSIIPRHRVDEFEELVTAGSAVDTRLAALQSVVRVFEAEPADHNCPVAILCERAGALALKLWDRDVFVAGETSAIAIEGTIAVVVLGGQSDGLIDSALQLGRPWAIRKLRRRLEEIREFRRSENSDHLALDAALGRLSSGIEHASAAR